MQKNIFRLLALVLLTTTSVQAQDLYMPRNIKQAYENGTRSMDGKPGKKYWQNKGKYNMTITVTPKTKLVEGTETIVYTNNSPDTLKQVTIRFVNNIHKPEAPRAGYASKDFLTRGLIISSFAIDGKKLKIDGKDWGTTGDVSLPGVLLPGKSATFAIDWNYPLSKESGREGQIDSNTFFVAYAFPRISVYDDYNGWDKIPHMDRVEFYNDFNDYQLAVKAPKNYVVWATGDLKNPDEVLQTKYAERLKKSYLSNEVTAIATADEILKGNVTRQNTWNTWKFSADHITDVTFSLSNHYNWDAGSVLVDGKLKRRASVQSAYSTAAKDFSHAVEWGKQALSWFSNNWPGVAYPFSKMTAVQGYADMEYPMMVNDSSTPDLEFTQFVLNHEIAHTYFPFYMGTNETRYAHMDEGWATTLEYLIGQDQLGKEKADENYKNFRVKRWIYDVSTEEDQPVISLSTQVSGSGYGNNAYVKPSLAYLGLKDMFGDNDFKKYLHAYMERWNGKHPIPWDFFYTMNDVSNQDLNWYWNSWFFSNNYIDLKIEKVAIKGSGYTVLLKNVGGFAVPFDVKIIYADGTKKVIHQTPAIWKTNPKSASVQFSGAKGVTAILIDGGIFMDAAPGDNNWKK
ncbi:M1 family metallopeptidase [Pedobacter sp. MR2016-24]|uniref:M1 family metallopeptidase n=1 Tax=Pedobacter sp. MR2016-24 TaxID=2994466 RepID=UPI0022481FDD|nr:M1 family metallopeptidase [Pedobacter sp. MR2016-24]MCX2485360.1 M1 family metallopeptidase [Pedobacter sp. MR2016-24]